MEALYCFARKQERLGAEASPSEWSNAQDAKALLTDLFPDFAGGFQMQDHEQGRTRGK